jgi:hypothetical protein
MGLEVGRYLSELVRPVWRRSMSSPEPPERSETQVNAPKVPTLADFVERSRKYGFDLDVEFDRPLYMDFPAPEVLG